MQCVHDGATLTCPKCGRAEPADIAADATPAKILPGTMTPDEFRRFAIGKVDAALGHSWLVTGDTRRLLQAMRTYLPGAPEGEIQKVMEAYPSS